MRHRGIESRAAEIKFVTTVGEGRISIVRSISHGLVGLLSLDFFAQIFELALEIFILNAQVFDDIVLNSREGRESK